MNIHINRERDKTASEKCKIGQLFSFSPFWEERGGGREKLVEAKQGENGREMKRKEVIKSKIGLDPHPESLKLWTWRVHPRKPSPIYNTIRFSRTNPKHSHPPKWALKFKIELRPILKSWGVKNIGGFLGWTRVHHGPVQPRPCTILTTQTWHS